MRQVNFMEKAWGAVIHCQLGVFHTFEKEVSEPTVSTTTYASPWKRGEI